MVGRKASVPVRVLSKRDHKVSVPVEKQKVSVPGKVSVPVRGGKVSVPVRAPSESDIPVSSVEDRPKPFHPWL